MGTATFARRLSCQLNPTERLSSRPWDWLEVTPVQQKHRKPDIDEPLDCCIRVAGEVGETTVACWSALQLTSVPMEDGFHESLLRGSLPDQSALIGVVNHLYDLGFVILSVECTTAGRTVALPVDDEDPTHAFQS